MRSFIIVIRILALAAILVHVYNVFTKDVVPKWSWALFTCTMLVLVIVNIRKLSTPSK